MSTGQGQGLRRRSKLAERGEGRHTGIWHHCPGEEEQCRQLSLRKGLLSTKAYALNTDFIELTTHNELDMSNTGSEAAHPTQGMPP